MQRCNKDKQPILTVSAVKQDLYTLPKGVNILCFLNEIVPFLYQNIKIKKAVVRDRAEIYTQP